MEWLVVGTLCRGRVQPAEQISEGDALQATESLFREQGLGVREWTTRWDLLNHTPEELYA